MTVSTVRLGDVAVEQRDKASAGHGFEVFSVTKYDGFVRSSDYFKKRVYSRDTSGYRIVRSGQFAYATIHLDEGSIGLLDHSSPVVISPMYTVFEADENRVHGPYLVRLMKSPRFIAEYARLGSGSVHRRRSIPFRVLANLKIPLPPLPEQRRIAAILDKADAVCRKRQNALDLADQFLRSAFLDLFGDPALPMATIGELLAAGELRVHKDGNHGSQYPRAEEFGAEGIPFLTARSVTDSGAIDNDRVQLLIEEKARQLKIGWLEKDDVLMAHNATVGRTAIYNGEYREALIGTSLTAFRADPSRLVPMYLLGALRSERFQHQLSSVMSQTTRNQVPITAQRRLFIPIPGMEEQKAYAGLVQRVTELSAQLQQSSNEAEGLQRSLTQRAFRGEL